jgi:phosphatidate cytidylyltransferase
LSNFTKRAITGALFVMTLILAISWKAYSFTVLFLVITIFSTWEFYKLIESAADDNQIKTQKYTGVIASAGIFLISALILQKFLHPIFILGFFPLICLTYIGELFYKADKPFTNLAYTVFGVAYVAVPFTFLNILAFYFSGGEYNSHLIIGFFVLLWSSDTGAYLAGSQFGKHKLFERISPKKSLEGSFGGAFVSICAAVILSNYFAELSRTEWIITAILIVVFGTFGDLVESMLKRSINVKDSGKLLPGHGGLLDRFDGLLISVPFVVFYLLLSRLF